MKQNVLPLPHSECLTTTTTLRYQWLSRSLSLRYSHLFMEDQRSRRNFLQWGEMVMMAFQASIGDTMQAVLRGAWAAGGEIPLPTSQMPAGGFKRKVLGGFWANRLPLLMTIKRAIGLAQCFLVWTARSLPFYHYYLHFMEQETEARWGAVTRPEPQFPSDGTETQTQDFWL